MPKHTWFQILICAIPLMTVAPSFGQAIFFPNASLGQDRSYSERYAKYLEALHEPSLSELSKSQKTQTYRFLWLRSFHHPVSVRLDIKADGSSTLTTKVSSGQGGYEPGKLIQDSIRTIKKEQTDWFLGRIEEMKFWSLPTEGSQEENVIGVDGAEWILEGVEDSKYHLVDRWSPEKGAVRALGIIMLIDLARLKLLYQDVY